MVVEGIEHTVLMDEDEAKRRGLAEAKNKAASASNKARTVANKSA